MRTRPVPGTDIAISEIGFGCGGNAGLMLRGTPAEQISVVARALELGISYFDTAPDYGNGAAETALGRALREIGGTPVITNSSGRPVITTKVEIRATDLADIAGHVVRSAEASLRRLGLERIDFLQIHNGPTPTPPPMQDGDYHHLWIDHFLGPRGAAEGLRRLIAAGKIGHAGFVSRGNDRAACAALLQTGLFRMINLSYSLLDPAPGLSEPILGLAQAEGCGMLATVARHASGVAAFSPLAGGLLAGPGPRHALARPADAASRRTQGRQHIAAQFTGDVVGLAYRFVLARPEVTTVIGGFSSVAQVEQIAARSGQTTLTGETERFIRRAWGMK